MHIDISKHQIITAYPTRERAEKVADELNDDGDEGEFYEVREVAHGFAIMHLEDGEDYGYL